jgi:hypothetical protein
MTEPAGVTINGSNWTKSVATIFAGVNAGVKMHQFSGAKMHR